MILMMVTMVMMVCTVIMLLDYHVKSVKYQAWKTRPVSAYTTPTHSCTPYTPAEDLHTSYSTISDYTTIPPTPARRRLLRRSQTMKEIKIKMKKKRKFSLPSKVPRSQLYLSVDTIDGDDEREDIAVESCDKLADIKPLEMKKMIGRKMKRTPAISAASDSSSSSLHKEDRLQQARSVSEFSCTSTGVELEYDLYDCNLSNAMAVPGSSFAPAYWDNHFAHTEELELREIFQDDVVNTNDNETDRDTEGTDEEQVRNQTNNSPVMPRPGQTEQKPLITSITSDLTTSISSAVSANTLVGDIMDTSCYYSADEDTSATLLKKERLNIMNLTHIEEIQFADE